MIHSIAAWHTSTVIPHCYTPSHQWKEGNHFNLNMTLQSWFIWQSACDFPFFPFPLSNSEKRSATTTNQLKIHTIQFNWINYWYAFWHEKVFFLYFQYFLCFAISTRRVCERNIINQNNIICIFFARAKKRGELIP